MEFIAYSQILAGVGILFIAFKQFIGAIQKITGEKFRLLLVKLISNLGSSTLSGLLVGFCIQDLGIVVSILGGLRALVHLAFRNLLFIIIASNIGALLFLYFIFFDSQLVIYLMLGITGVLLYVEKPNKYQKIVEILFYFFLIQFAVLFINNSAVVAMKTPFMNSMTQQLQNSNPLLLFLLSGIIVVLCQSSIPLLLMSINFLQHHLIGFEHLMIIIYGIHLGNASRTYLFSLGFRGIAKQLFIFQTLFGLFTAFFFLMVYYIENHLGTHVIESMFSSNSIRTSTQVINLILFIEGCTGILFMIGSNQIASFLQHFYPFNEEEDTSTLVYANLEMVNDTDSAVEALQMENVRLLKIILKEIDIRMEQHHPPYGKNLIVQQHKKFEELNGVIDNFIHVLLSHQFTGADSMHTFITIEEFHTISLLEFNIFHIATMAPPNYCSDKVLDFVEQSFEVVHVSLYLLIEYMQDRNEENLQVVKSLAKMDEPLVERYQEKFFNDDVLYPKEEKDFLFSFISLIQQLKWSIGQVLNEISLHDSHTKNKRTQN